MDSDEEFFCSSATLNFVLNKKRSVHPLNSNRNEKGEFCNLYNDLRKDPEKFFNYTRMSISTFDYIFTAKVYKYA